MTAERNFGEPFSERLGIIQEKLYGDVYAYPTRETA